MRKGAALVLLAVAGVTVGWFLLQAGRATGTSTNTTAKPPAASVTEKPLLLDDPPLLLATNALGTNPAAGAVADNSRCQVCHLNLSLEELTLTHARTNIGCIKCHGECDAHIADESWASGGKGTPPELMYPKHKINAMCRECHKTDKQNPNRPGKPCPKLSGAWTTQKFCTDCHGKHRLAERKCRWR